MLATSIAVLGASPNPDRYSNMLVRRLKEAGRKVYPINPAGGELAGLAVYRNIDSLPAGVEVLSVYLNASRSDALADAIVSKGIPRVIFNPGAENPALAARLRQQGATVEEACSLVLNSIGRL